jgi:hypothetical protein
MEPTITAVDITCGNCGFIFARSKEFTSCSNCFACTGCEIYYCPKCDTEVVITPVKKAGRRKAEGGRKDKRQKHE